MILHTIVAIAWWASNIHPQVTICELATKALAKRGEGGGLEAAWETSVCPKDQAPFVDSLWTFNGPQNCQIYHSLWTLLEWKLLVVIEKEPKKKHYTHKEGRKEGRITLLLCSTLWPYFSHFFSFCKAPTCKAFENFLAYLEGNIYAWISYMYKWGGSYAYL
jgi:hypothetical protein